LDPGGGASMVPDAESLSLEREAIPPKESLQLASVESPVSRAPRPTVGFVRETLGVEGCADEEDKDRSEAAVFADETDGGRTHKRRVAWPDQLVVVSKPVERFLRRRLASGATLSSDQRRALAVLDEDGASQMETEGANSKQLIVNPGSARPHSSDPEAMRRIDPMDLGSFKASMRHIEPEIPEVLRIEPMPESNEVPETDFELPPLRHAAPPGPFTTEELIPDKMLAVIVDHGDALDSSAARAGRGKNGHHQAKKLRPECRAFTEKQALNPCGRGHIWRFNEADRKWHVVQPSSSTILGEDVEEDPPEGRRLNVKRLAEDAAEKGMTDKQLLSWHAHGFPGADLPGGAVFGRYHVGALRNVGHMVACQAKDVEAGFVTNGFELPEFWPCYLDCFNVAMQRGKPRLCVDKTIEMVDGTVSYNGTIFLDDDPNRVRLPGVGTLCRAASILRTCGIEVLIGKLDLASFFRVHPKQRAYIHQSQRRFPDGWGSDLGVNFGERDAPDHCCRSSNAVNFFIRWELERLDREYPSVDPLVRQWIADRLEALAADTTMPYYRKIAMFYSIFYVDDEGLAVINDAIVDTQGRPVHDLVHGVRTVRMRAPFYYEAVVGVVEYYLYKAPEKKREYMGLGVEYLGSQVSLTTMRRTLAGWKRIEYLDGLKKLLGEASAMPNGTIKVDFADFKTAVHRLLHACDVYPLGRQRLHHSLAALRAVGERKTAIAGTVFAKEEVILTKKAQQEFAWWIEVLEVTDPEGVPLASRSAFPTAGSEEVLVYYGDASREGDVKGVKSKHVKGLESPKSGFGAWEAYGADFVYIIGTWTREEIEQYSINVLEAKIRDMALFAFAADARARGRPITHVLGFTDNTAAEHTAERGRTHSDALSELLRQRQEGLLSEGLSAASARCASVDNVLADWLSRGDLDEVLRVAVACGLTPRELRLTPAERSLEGIAPSF
jgi:hypothetical protein